QRLLHYGSYLLRIAALNFSSLLDSLIDLLGCLRSAMIDFLCGFRSRCLGISPNTIYTWFDFGNAFFSHFADFFCGIDDAFLSFIGKDMQKIWIGAIWRNRFAGLCF